MGDQTFAGTQPESFLFGENSELNLLSPRPVSVRENFVIIICWYCYVMSHTVFTFCIKFFVAKVQYCTKRDGQSIRKPFDRGNSCFVFVRILCYVFRKTSIYNY